MSPEQGLFLFRVLNMLLYEEVIRNDESINVVW